MKAFILFDAEEKHRTASIHELIGKAPFPVVPVEAVFPSKVRVPLQERLLALARSRTHYPMVAGELGCLLGHRKIWRSILAERSDPSQHFLVLESDSCLLDMDLLASCFEEWTKGSDLFFWGAFDGRTKLFASGARQVTPTHKIGEPLINSLYCTYGYSLTPLTARLLLRRTASITYPVDHFKRYLRAGELDIRSVVPQLISGVNTGGSQTRPWLRTNLYSFLFDRVVDIKNELLTRIG